MLRVLASLVTPKVFDELKTKLEEEAEVRQDLGKLADEVDCWGSTRPYATVLRYGQTPSP